MSSPSSSNFAILDYILFSFTLLLSTAIGIFYAFSSWRNKEGVNAFLTGSRRMPLIPTALSLLVSFVSGISVISYPTEVYTYGLVFIWMILGAAVSPAVSALVIMPVLHRIGNCVSIYAYLEYRFGSVLLRSYGSILYQLSTLLYLAVVLYTPSVAFAGVTGIDVRVLIACVGLLCALYTAIGGLKAVVWSDCFQAIIMYAGLMALAIKGTMAAGGVKNVLGKSWDYGRLEGVANFDPNPFQYMTAWTGFFGGFFYWLISFSTDQTALQRYYSLPTLKKAQVAAFINVPSILTIMALIVYIGLTMTANYARCDPRLAGHGVERDQLLISYMMDTLGPIYGLPGLFVACTFSATLSSVSSGINSFSTVFLEDVVKPLTKKTPLTDRQATVVTKCVGAFYGLAAVGLAFVTGRLGGVFKAAISAYGSLSGPLLGMFILGVLFPQANWIGASVGAMVASATTLRLFFGNLAYQVSYPELPTYADMCSGANGTLLFGAPANGSIWKDEANESISLFTPDLQGFEKVYATPFTMFPCVGAFITVTLGLVVSIITGSKKRSPGGDRFTYWTRQDDEKPQIKDFNGIS